MSSPASSRGANAACARALALLLLCGGGIGCAAADRFHRRDLLNANDPFTRWPTEIGGVIGAIVVAPLLSLAMIPPLLLDSIDRSPSGQNATMGQLWDRARMIAGTAVGAPIWAVTLRFVREVPPERPPRGVPAQAHYPPTRAFDVPLH